MRIDGYAYTSNEKNVVEEYKRIRDSLSTEDIKIESVRQGYTTTVYSGILLNKELSELEVALLCSNSLAFGCGVSIFNDNNFVCEVYTD